MTWRVFACCFSLWLVLPARAEIQTLNNTEDLHAVKFGKEFPYQGLKLLHWFASILKIDQNEVIRPLNFKLDQGIYGFHYYGNCIDRISNKRALPKLEGNRKYYAVGNLNREEIRRNFPYYVQEDYQYSSNADRIVIDVNKSNLQEINHVYVTQHYVNRSYVSSYDPDNTFSVSTSLLRQIKVMTWDKMLQEQIGSSETPYLGTTDSAPLIKSPFVHNDNMHWIDLNLGVDVQTLYCIEDLRESTHFGKEFPRHGLMLLHWFADNVEMGSNGVIRPHNFRPDRRDYGFQAYASSKYSAVFPDISSNGVYYSLGDLDPRAVQNAFPRYVTQDYHNSQSPLRNIDRVVIDVNRDDAMRISQVYITQEHVSRGRLGQYDPSNTFRVSPSLLRQIQDLNQLQIAEEQRASDLQMAYPHSPGLMRFLTLAGYNIDLRLSLFSQSTFCWTPNTHPDPRSSTCEAQNDIKLEVTSTSNGQARITWRAIPESLLELDVYVSLYENSCSLTEITEAYPLNGQPNGSIDTDVTLKPGLQVRLTESGKSCSNLWRGPEFDDANGVLPKEISGVEGMNLQLFTKDSYACARLYVKKSFTSWIKDHYYYSWVGFYASAKDRNDKYKTYQYIRKFTKISNQDSPKGYDTYEYKSKINTGPGVEARLFLDSDGQVVGARTEPWEGVINPETRDDD